MFFCIFGLIILALGASRSSYLDHPDWETI